MWGSPGVYLLGALSQASRPYHPLRRRRNRHLPTRHPPGRHRPNRRPDSRRRGQAVVRGGAEQYRGNARVQGVRDLLGVFLGQDQGPTLLRGRREIRRGIRQVRQHHDHVHWHQLTDGKLVERCAVRDDLGTPIQLGIIDPPGKREADEPG